MIETIYDHPCYLIQLPIIDYYEFWSSLDRFLLVLTQTVTHRDRLIRQIRTSTTFWISCRFDIWILALLISSYYSPFFLVDCLLLFLLSYYCMLLLISCSFTAIFYIKLISAL